MILKLVLIAIVSLLPAGGAAADSAGAAALQKCKICHALVEAGGNRVGPNLHGIFGRRAGSEPGSNASDAMKNSGIVWDDESLAKFLRDPKGSVPGNRMSFPGVEDEALLRDLLLELKRATQ